MAMAATAHDRAMLVGISYVLFSIICVCCYVHYLYGIFFKKRIRLKGPGNCDPIDLNHDIKQYAQDPLETFHQFDSSLRSQVRLPFWLITNTMYVCTVTYVFIKSTRSSAPPISCKLLTLPTRWPIHRGHRALTPRFPSCRTETIPALSGAIAIHREIQIIIAAAAAAIVEIMMLRTTKAPI